MLNKIDSDLASALKMGKRAEATALRGLKAALQNLAISQKKSLNFLSETDIISTINKELRKCQESLFLYEKEGRDDLAAKERSDISILMRYLPQKMTRNELEHLVSSVIAELDATDKKQMGQVIKEVAARAKGAADNREISEIVKSKL